MKINIRKKATLAALAGNGIFGFSFMFSKVILNQVSPFTLLAVRFCMAFLCLNLIVWFGKMEVQLKGKKMAGILSLGIAQPILYFTFENYGIDQTNSVIAGAVISLVPVVSLLLARIFLGEKFNAMQAACTVLSVAGVMMISVSGNQAGTASVLGILLLCGAVVSTTAFNMLSRKISDTFTAFERTYVMFAMGSVFFTAAAIITQGSGFAGELKVVFTSGKILISLAYLGIISSVAAFLLLNWAVNELPIAKASSFANLTAVVSMAAGFVFLKEHISLMHFSGCVLVLLSIYGVNKFGRN